MKRIFPILLAAFALPLLVAAQDFTNADTLRFVDAMKFRMINYAFEKTLDTRIPRWLEDSVRPELRDRARHTAGKAFRFRTDSRAVAVRYQLLYNAHMMHMADTGIKGTCLYIWDEDTRLWQFVNCNRPNASKGDTIQRKVLIDRLDGKMHEYMLYLPLYDGVKWCEIGVEKNSTLSQPALNSPRQGKKLVFYGTSILHGGCASHPGMVATNIIQRDLDIECVNIGISGEGKMDYCMARAMATIPDVAAYILDPIPNCTKDMCDTLTYEFVNILRRARPDVPIIMVEGQMYSYAKYSGFYSKYLPQKNYEFHKNYLRLRAENPKNLYYVDCKNLYGPNNDGTVDGIHLTDLGFYYYAQKLEPYIKAVLQGKKVPHQREVNKPYKPVNDPVNY
ncbi:MAG: SGNH/GDSL hydrolase family protein [Muribaculaceae bacterium]|nr:SGNH/GDSL hydrolase family protein [Muribaculaceae bacterium]